MGRNNARSDTMPPGVDTAEIPDEFVDEPLTDDEMPPCGAMMGHRLTPFKDDAGGPHTRMGCLHCEETRLVVPPDLAHTSHRYPPWCDVQQTSEAIGNAIVAHLSEGDHVIITTQRTRQLRATVVNAPAEIPSEESETAELICDIDDEPGAVALHARVTDIGEMSNDYAVYAVRLPEDGGSEDLGAIWELIIE